MTTSTNRSTTENIIRGLPPQLSRRRTNHGGDSCISGFLFVYRTFPPTKLSMAHSTATGYRLVHLRRRLYRQPYIGRKYLQIFVAHRSPKLRRTAARFQVYVITRLSMYASKTQMSIFSKSSVSQQPWPFRAMGNQLSFRDINKVETNSEPA